MDEELSRLKARAEQLRLLLAHARSWGMLMRSEEYGPILRDYLASRLGEIRGWYGKIIAPEDHAVIKLAVNQGREDEVLHFIDFLEAVKKDEKSIDVRLKELLQHIAETERRLVTQSQERDRV